MYSLLASFFQDPLFNMAASVLAVSSLLSPGAAVGAQENAVRTVSDLTTFFGISTSTSTLLLIDEAVPRGPYNFQDIKSVYVEQFMSPVGGKFKRYHISLKDGNYRIIGVPEEALSVTEQRFRESGYAGDINLILNFNATSADGWVVTPASGTAPLTVTAMFDRGSSCSAYTIDWGDGAQSNVVAPTDLACPQVVVEDFKVPHTYTKAGTYTLTLTQGGQTYTKKVTVTGGSGGGNGDLSVSPSSGAAPLTVTATYDLGSSCSSYSLSWGDGTNTGMPGVPSDIACAAVVVEDAKQTHTYTKAGTYTVTLQQNGKTSTAKVTVGGGNTGGKVTDSFTATPARAAVNQAIRFSFAVPQRGEYEIEFGDGTTAKNFQWAIPDCAGGNCESAAYAQTSHAYLSPGTYTVILSEVSTCTGTAELACTGLYSAEIDRLTVTVTAGNSGTNGQLSVTPASGSAPLNVTATFDRGSRCSSYIVNWGDGTQTSEEGFGDGLVACDQVVVQDFKIQHQYQRAGSYTVTLRQGDQRSSATVKVVAANSDSNSFGDRASAWFKGLFGGGSDSGNDSNTDNATGEQSNRTLGDRASAMWQSLFGGGRSTMGGGRAIVDPSNPIDSTYHPTGEYEKETQRTVPDGGSTDGQGDQYYSTLPATNGSQTPVGLSD